MIYGLPNTGNSDASIGARSCNYWRPLKMWFFV